MSEDQPFVISVRYFRNFKGFEKVILISGNAEELRKLSNLLAAHPDAALIGRDVTDHFRLSVGSGRRSEAIFEKDAAYCTLAEEDANRFAELIYILATSDGPGHQYLDLDNSDCDCAILVSKDEYPVRGGPI